MIMSGTRSATLIRAQLVDIHGTRFYDLVYTHDDAPQQQRSARIGLEDAYANPQPGDTVAVRYMMNVAVGVTRR